MPRNPNSDQEVLSAFGGVTYSTEQTPEEKEKVYMQYCLDNYVLHDGLLEEVRKKLQKKNQACPLICLLFDGIVHPTGMCPHGYRMWSESEVLRGEAQRKILSASKFKNNR